jgi:hypothetical protein
MLESVLMEKIPGRLIMDLLPEGEVGIVFLRSSGDNDASPIKAKDINAAEFLFLNCGISVERAADLRAEVSRNKVAGVGISVEEEIAARFRHTFPFK